MEQNKWFILYNPSSGKDDILDRDFMTQEIADKINSENRIEGSDDRWILDKNQDNPYYEKTSEEEYYESHITWLERDSDFGEDY